MSDVPPIKRIKELEKRVELLELEKFSLLHQIDRLEAECSRHQAATALVQAIKDVIND